MRARAVGCLAAAAVLATTGACIYPSFDGLQGGTPREAGADDDGAAKSDASTRPDARTFACDSNGLRCELDFEVCCGQYLNDSICKKPPVGVIECSELLKCGDLLDCTGGEVCCFDLTTKRGVCEKTCAGVDRLVVCDSKKSPTSCPGTQSCAGLWENTVPFCK